jgi:hypothetical protein
MHFGKAFNVYKEVMCGLWFTYFMHGTGYSTCKIAQLGVLGI